MKTNFIKRSFILATISLAGLTFAFANDAAMPAEANAEGEFITPAAEPSMSPVALPAPAILPQESAEEEEDRMIFGLGVECLFQKSCLNLREGLKLGYKFYREAYGAAGIAYTGCSYDDGSIKMSTHYISFPVEVGYIFGKDSKVKLIPCAGLMIDVCVANKVESKFINSKEKPDAGVVFRPGLKIGFGIVAVSGYYNIPLNDGSKYLGSDGYFSAGISLFF